jgi:hypothetical protein
MRHQFGFRCQSNEKEAKHLKRSLCRFTTRPKIDQHACDDRTVTLNLNSVLAVADQVGASQELLEEAEEYFNCPPLSVNQPNDLRRNIKKVGCDSQHSIAAWSGRSPLVSATTGMRVALDANQTHRMIP